LQEAKYNDTPPPGDGIGGKLVYYYVVTASNMYGESAPSNTVSVKMYGMSETRGSCVAPKCEPVFAAGPVLPQGFALSMPGTAWLRPPAATTNNSIPIPQNSITISRTTYMLAGQAIAVRVIGDPNPANNGLFYLYTDHLGSVSAMGGSNGTQIGDTIRYYPFGGYRTGGPSPVTDRGFTGQRENMSLGLYYYNARYYLPGVGRFLSADTIVPDPQNPQSLNRYAYVLNSPLNYSDPTGHRECGASDDCSDPLPYSIPPTPPKILDGLPLQGSDWKTDNYHNGFGANWYAQKYANPNSPLYDGTYVNSAGLHPGIDFIVPAGTPVYANVSGTVVSRFPNDGKPNVVVATKYNGEVYYVVYGHVESSIEVGMEVNPGVQIGTVWLYIVTREDGSQYDNSHLHLAVRQERRVYNPAHSFISPSSLNNILWNSYSIGESLYSISSYQYGAKYNFWTNGDNKIGVRRP
jgi:RHS repeat-associated protein